MKKLVLCLCLFLLCLAQAACDNDAASAPKAGDIIFQSLNTPQSLAIKLATGSDYTHCGIILEKDGRLMVFEAVGPVKWTPLEDWIKQGVDRRYLLMRLKDEHALTPEKLAAMQADTNNYLGKPYDIFFKWSDDKMYCSEVVWKLYERNIGLELGKPRRLGDYNLNHEEVRRIARQRYGEDLPLDELVIAPSDIIASDSLKVVREK